MPQTKFRIIYNRKVNHNCFHCAFESRSIAKESLPGQFLNIRVSETFDPLLRRPFSIHKVTGTTIEILYETLGKASNILSQKKAGEYLDIIGPLGNGFNDLEPRTHNLKPILVAGGMGVAPFMFLAASLRAPKGRSNLKSGIASASPRNDNSLSTSVVVLIGAKTKNHILCEKDFKKLGCEVKIATDDGSRGFKGYVSELLKNLLSTIDYRLLTIYACGPRPMLKEITLISKNQKIPAQISLEEHMSCGIGACLGCVVDTRQGFKRVCKEGPIFKADEIIW